MTTDTFELVFMKEEDFNKHGILENLFKTKDKIKSYEVIKSRFLCYAVEKYIDFPSVDSPFEVKEIEIPFGYFGIVGYYNK